ncbi:hypothetical protein HY624_01090 [Candidatus Uhrbacteria bacterium]|nr:hypothetical protein [Candidatus Uhrbacteria bacterium]
MKNFLKENWFLLITALFLVGALGSWPYGYYQLLRWIVCGVGAYSAYKAYELGRTGWAWTFGVITILFNPILPFYMQRETWQVIDIVATVPFLVFPFVKK